MALTFDDPAAAQAALDAWLAKAGEPDRTDEATGAAINDIELLIDGARQPAVEYFFVDGRGTLYWSRLTVVDSPLLRDDPEAFALAVADTLVNG